MSDLNFLRMNSHSSSVQQAIDGGAVEVSGEFDRLIHVIEESDSTSVGQIFRAIQDGDDQQHFLKHLKARIAEHDKDIERMCNFHYQGFVDSIGELLKVRKHAEKLKEGVLSTNKALQRSGQPVIQQADDLDKTRRTQCHILATVDNLQLCLPVLEMYCKLNEQMDNKRYYPALKTLEQLEHTYLPRVKCYRFCEEMAENIPKLREGIKDASMSDLKDFLESIRKHSDWIGEEAMKQVHRVISLEFIFLKRSGKIKSGKKMLIYTKSVSNHHDIDEKDVGLGTKQPIKTDSFADVDCTDDRKIPIEENYDDTEDGKNPFDDDNDGTEDSKNPFDGDDDVDGTEDSNDGDGTEDSKNSFEDDDGIEDRKNLYDDTENKDYTPELKGDANPFALDINESDIEHTDYLNPFINYTPATDKQDRKIKSDDAFVRLHDSNTSSESTHCILSNDTSNPFADDMNLFGESISEEEHISGLVISHLDKDTDSHLTHMSGPAVSCHNDSDISYIVLEGVTLEESSDKGNHQLPSDGLDISNPFVEYLEEAVYISEDVDTNTLRKVNTQPMGNMLDTKEDSLRPTVNMLDTKDDTLQQAENMLDDDAKVQRRSHIESSVLYKHNESSLIEADSNPFTEYIVEEEEEEVNAQDKVDFSPVYRCLHIYSVLGERDVFESYYRKQRAKQSKLAIQPQGNMYESLQHYQKFFYQILGFFVVEDHIMNTTEGLVTREYLDDLWNVSLTKITAVLRNNSAYCTDATLLLQIKDQVVLFSQTLNSYGFSTLSVYQLLFELKDQYNEILMKTWVQLFSAIFDSDNYTAIAVQTEQEFNSLMRTFPFSDELIEKTRYPKRLPFSEFVPKVYHQIKEFIYACHKFSQDLHLAQTERDDMIRKSTNILLTRTLSGCLSELIKRDSLGLVELVQVTVNTIHLENACEYLEDFISNITGTTGDNIHAQGLQSTNIFRDARSEAELEIYKRLNAKVDEFLELASYDWTLDESKGHASGYIQDVISFLEGSFKAFKHLPGKVAQTACLSTCKHLANSLMDFLLDDNVRYISMGAIQQFSLDVIQCELFANSEPVPGFREGALQMTFLQLRQLLDLFMAWDWSSYLADYGQSNSKYSRVNPHTAIAILEKMKDTEKKKTFLPTFKKNERDRKKLMDMVLKQLKTLVGSPPASKVQTH